MIELHIIHTVRRAGQNQAWYRTHDTTEHFPTLREAKAWCRETLGRNFRPTYRDTKDGGSVRCGRIYSAREREHRQTYYKQYWVSAYEVTPITLR